MITSPNARWFCAISAFVLVILLTNLLSLSQSSFPYNTNAIYRTSPGIKSSVAPQPPSDYPKAYLQDPIERCENRYGLNYLQHLATHHIRYCEPASKSTFECFQTQDQDVFCVAHGVQHTTSPGRMPFSMNCQMRNFSVEIENDPLNTEELKGYPTSDFKKYYMYDTGMDKQLASWEDSDGEACNAESNDGTFTLLLRREGTGNIWHRLLEMWQVKHSLDALEMSDYIPGFNRKKVEIVFSTDDKGPWDELVWPMITGKMPLYQSEFKRDGCLGTVILPLPGSTSPYWYGVWEDLPCRTSYLLDPFINDMLKFMGLNTPPRLTDDTVLTIVNRTGTSRTRQLWNIDSHAEALRKSFPGVTVQVQDFSVLSLTEQIQMIRGTDVFMGAMGAGLTHIFWLPEESSFAEIMAPGAHYSGFRNLAKVRRIPYFTTHGVLEEEFVKGEDYLNWKGAIHKPKAKVQVPKSEASSAVKTIAQKDTKKGRAEDAETTATTRSVTDEDAEIQAQTLAEHEAYLAEAWRNMPGIPGSPIEPMEDFDGYDDYERDGARPIAKRHWQNDEYLYMTEKQFIALAAAAIHAQSNRGTRSQDIIPH